MPNPTPLITPHPDHTDNTPKPPVDRDGKDQTEGNRPQELPGEKKPNDTPLPIDPSQEKPDLTPLVLAQLDPEAGFNGA